MGTIPLREAVLSAVTAQLLAQLPDVPADRARRAPVDPDKEKLPRLAVIGGDMTADETQEPGRTHYRVEFGVVGYAKGKTDLEAEQALSLLHARAVEALAGWTPAAAGLSDVAEEGAEFTLYDVADSATPAGEFTARFSMLAVAVAGNPWSS